MQNTGQLIDLLEALPNLTRFSVAFDGKTMQPEVANRLAQTLNRHEKLKRLDIINVNLEETDQLDLSGILSRLTRFTWDVIGLEPEKLLASTGPELTQLCINPINSEELQRLVTELNPRLATTVTSLTIEYEHKDPGTIQVIADHFVNLKSLKMFSCYDEEANRNYSNVSS